MSYALSVGLRYLRSKKRATVSVISVIAICGVALGVAALLSVVSITSGFQEEFRTKVLGVNAHVLVLKYGLNFEEYRDVVARSRKMPEVVGAAPFIINEMMLAKEDRLSGVLIKGVDPEQMRGVLDLPGQLTSGSLEGLRVPGARPATRPEDLQGEVGEEEDHELDEFLQELAVEGEHELAAEQGREAEQPAGQPVAQDAGVPDAGAGAPHMAEGEPTPSARELSVPSLEQAQRALQELELSELPSDEAEAELIADSEPEGPSLPDDRKLPGVVVGIGLAKSLGIEVGDHVKIISPLTGLDTSLWRPDGGTPTSRDFRVIGIFEAGFQEYDTRLVYVDLYEAQVFQDQGDTVVGVEIRLDDIDQASDVARRLERELGGGPFHTMDWKQLNHNLFVALEMQKTILTLVFTVIVVVAAFVVVATLIMIVLEKRREIAILKAMGAKDASILGIFAIQGIAIGVLGTLLGLILGGVVCAYLSVIEFPLDPKVYLIDHVPVRANLTDFMLTAAISMVICATATLIPSWWAARLLPADGVRPQ